MNKVVQNIDEYIAQFPQDIQKLLHQIRKTIKHAAPAAEETIKYAMPTFTLKGNLVHFAAFKNHIGFYPMPAGIEAFEKELSLYKKSKGAIQFPLNKPLPFSLISEIVQFRIKENLREAAKKESLKTCPKGHKYYKSSDCPICPACERERKPSAEFLSLLTAPARRALESKGILSLSSLSKFSEREILNLHGIGPSSLPTLRKALAEKGLSFHTIA